MVLVIPKQIAFADEPIILPKLVDVRVLKLVEYFTKNNCPLLPYADNFILAADKYDIDWRLLAAISISESTCGKRYPKNTNNPFGWHPIRNSKGEISVLGFESLPIAIDTISGQLANAKPYANKTTFKKLSTYCPTPGYPERTMGYMKKIYAE